MDTDSTNEFYAIEFSRSHNPARVLILDKGTPETRTEILARGPLYGWAIFRVRDGIKTPTGCVEKTEEKAKSIVNNWLRLDYERAAKAAHRAVNKDNRLAELTGGDQLSAESSTKGNEVKAKEVAPYVWTVSDADRILAHGLGIQLW